MNSLRRNSLAGAGLLLASLLIASPSAFAQFTGPKPMTLLNGWKNAPFATSNVTAEEVSGIVQLRGAVASGTTSQLFVLPIGLRPPAEVWVAVDLCDSTNGRVVITTAGQVSVQQQGGGLTAAQCFTSLDGVSFAASVSGFQALTLTNGWVTAGFGNGAPGVAKINGMVYLKGAMSTASTDMNAFVLPAAFRPATEVYVHADLCNATNGRLHIQPTGNVDVETEGGVIANAQCFTSLDGISFKIPSIPFTALTPINGWTGGPFATATPKAGNSYGLVYFQGAISTAGTNPVAFTLPAAFRPVTNVYVPVDLCDATKGRLFIQTNGIVTVQFETVFSNAQCFTSLDGVSFVQ